MKKSRAPRPEEIRAVREKSGLTQEEAAALIGYTRRAWQEWEAGTRGMRRALFDLFVQRQPDNQEAKP